MFIQMKRMQRIRASVSHVPIKTKDQRKGKLKSMFKGVGEYLCRVGK